MRRWGKRSGSRAEPNVFGLQDCWRRVSGYTDTRDETDLVERLHAMADDALAGRDGDAVDREVAIARRVLGLDKKGGKESSRRSWSRWSS